MTLPGNATTIASGDDEPLPRRRMVFAIVSLGLLMSTLDNTIVATALGSIERDLGAQIQWSGWTISAYSLAQVVAMPLAGKIADLYGRKRVFIAAGIIFTLASLCCGLSQDVYTLIAMRFVQALGGGAFMPTASGIVADHFGRDRDRALGMFTSIFPIGAILGPILGGVIVTFWSWREIFFINIPIGVALVVLSALLLPRSGRRATARLDLVVLGALVILSLGLLARVPDHRGRW